MSSTLFEHEIDNAFVSAINEGDMHNRWLDLAKADKGNSASFQYWHDVTSKYVARLRKEGRSTLPLTVWHVGEVVDRLRSYYKQYLLEL